MPSYITESYSTAFKALLACIKNWQKDDKGKKKNNKYVGLQKSSIMKASKDLVMSFPVLCSDSIQPATAMMITKAVERNCVSTLNMLFSASYMQGKNGQDVLAQWHQNMNNDFGMDDYLALVDKFAPALDKIKESVIPTDIMNQIVKENAENNSFFPEESFTENGISAFEIKDKVDGYDVHFVNEANNNNKKEDMIDAVRYVTDKDGKVSAVNVKLSKAQADYELKLMDYNARRNEHEQDRQLKINQGTKQDTQNNTSKDNYNLQKDRFEEEKKQNQIRNDRMDRSEGLEFYTKNLLPNDVKKCNELVPSLIIVRFAVVDGTNTNGNAAPVQEFVAGVKATLYPTSSEEIIDRVGSVFSNKVNRLNWVRATTGEISFKNDFVLGLSQAKIDAKRDSRLAKGSGIWRSLQYRSSKSGINRLIRKNRSNDAGAITTLVITSEEVDYLKKTYDIDLNIPAKAQYLMEQYNFMGIVIVDENFEVAKFLFDGSSMFEDYSFSTLEKESNDKSYKQVVNLISKINRG